MLLLKALPVAMFFLLCFQSGVASTVVTSPSIAMTASTPSSNSSSSASGASQMNQTTSITSESSMHQTNATSSPSPAANTVTSSVMQSGGGASISPTTSGAHSVNMTASMSVPDVEWYKWDTDDCQKTCCDTGGPVISQKRKCKIHRPRCNLTECENYGPVTRDISCYTACAHCMPDRSLGFVKAAPGINTIITALFIWTVIVKKMP